MKRSGYSIRQQITIIFVVLLIGTVSLVYLINTFFLEQFYVSNKHKTLLMAYNAINKAATENTIDGDDFDLELRKLCGKHNLSVIVLDSESQTVICSSNDNEMLARMLLENFFEPVWMQKEEIPDAPSGNDFGDRQRQDHRETRILEENDKYTIERMTDRMTSTDFLEMWGVLENGCLFMVRSPIEAIRESVEIANRFLMYAGIIAGLLGAVIIYFVSARITRPIHKLADISERMIHMDFNAKFTDHSNSDIELLGENINTLSETLEKTISELKSANIELQRDIEKKEEIDRMRQEFLSNVSHELKTPIALIQGYAEGLQAGINDDDAESRNFYCDVIIDEASKMNIMVKKLLTLNQLEFGTNPVTMEHFDVVELIKTYIQNAEILTRQEGIEVKMRRYDPIYVWADEFMTEEVFMNYFTNAMHHCSRDKIIEVKLQKKEDCVRISVFNTGDPIPEESLEHVWEKFYKVDKARTREYGGSGVGLSIVKAIVKSFGRECGVINYDNGVEFWFELDTTGAGVPDAE